MCAAKYFLLFGLCFCLRFILIVNFTSFYGVDTFTVQSAKVPGKIYTKESHINKHNIYDAAIDSYCKIKSYTRKTLSLFIGN